MAHLEKKTYTRWMLDGRQVPAKTPGARKVQEESRYWYVVIQHPDTGKTVRVNTKLEDKASAEEVMAELIRWRGRRMAQLPTPQDLLSQARQQSILEHLESYLSDRRSRGRNPEHLSNLGFSLRRLFRDARVQTLGDCDIQRVHQGIEAVSDRSSRTKNKLLGYVKAFIKWLVQRGLLSDNPFLGLERYSGPKARDRRALTVEELHRLLDAARRRPLLEAQTIRRGPRKGQIEAKVKPTVLERMTQLGESRALLYEFAAFTGLRKGEIWRLQVQDFDQDQGRVRVQGAENQKQKKDVWQPLPPGLVAKLKEYLATTQKKPQDKLLPMWKQKVAEVLRADLELAGIPYRDEHGRVFDFHAFRHCTATYLLMSGVPIQEAQKYMRHATIQMTMDVYHDAALVQAENAANKLGMLGEEVERREE